MLDALIPVFSLILIGVFLKRVRFPGADFWRGAERITYYLLLPSLLFLKLSTINLSGEVQLLQLVLLLLAMLLIISLLLVLIGYWLKMDAAVFTSLFQGGIRFNTYVGLAVINGLLGDSGIAIAAVVVGIMIPAVNLLCIAVFAVASDGAKINGTSMARNIATNPLILTCMLGIFLNNLGFVLPDLSISVLGLLSATALPLGLLSVGAGVHMGVFGDSVKPLVISSVIKLFVSPLLAYLLCWVFDMTPVATLVIVIMASLPTASSAYILSRELGGDSKVMAAIIAGQTLIAMLCMPVVINYIL